MVPLMAATKLRLELCAKSTLPNQCSWHIEQGCIRVVSLTEAGDHTLLGLWGPGELLIPTSLGIAHQEWLAMTEVKVSPWEPSADEREDFILDQLHQTATMLVLHRVRPIEEWLLQLLIWLGEKFGRINSLGISLSAKDLNLTHHNLAELAGTTRVTVTKALTRLRLDQQLLTTATNDILIPYSRLWRDPMQGSIKTWRFGTC
jgi:hypothetical protein